MKKAIIFLLLTVSVLSGCKKEDDDVVEPEISISNFSFKKASNPNLTNDIYTIPKGNSMSGNIPYEIDIRYLVASFDFIGEEVRIGEDVQKSSITANDFSSTVTYTVVGKEGNTKDYDVNILWFTGLPIFKIVTDYGVEITSKEEYIVGKANIIGVGNYDDASGDMKIRGRGHSTWGLHPKKPYQLKFDKKTKVLGMPKDKKWLLLAEHSDKTLMRNQLAFEMGYISNLDWTPECVYAEVFLNDEYNGTYNICQKVEGGNHRVDLGDDGYLLEIDTPDHLDPDDVYFNSSRFTIQVKEPETTIGSPIYHNIKNYVLEFENILYSNNFTDPVYGYRRYIDVNSFVDWFIINEIAKNQDARSYSSIFFNYIPGEKIKMGPLWDFDLGFGNVDYSECVYPTGFWVKEHAWIKRLLQDPYFVNEVKERYKYFSSQESYFIQLIDEKAEYLRLAQQENDNRWHVFGNYIWPNPVVYDTHQEEVQHLKEWLVTRMRWLDDAIEAM